MKLFKKDVNATKGTPFWGSSSYKYNKKPVDQPIPISIAKNSHKEVAVSDFLLRLRGRCHFGTGQNNVSCGGRTQ